MLVVVVVVAVVLELLPRDGDVDTDCGGFVFVNVLCVRALTSFCRLQCHYSRGLVVPFWVL